MANVAFDLITADGRACFAEHCRAFEEDDSMFLDMLDKRVSAQRATMRTNRLSHSPFCTCCNGRNNRHAW